MLRLGNCHRRTTGDTSVNSPCIIKRPDGRYACSVLGIVLTKNAKPPIRCICGSTEPRITEQATTQASPALPGSVLHDTLASYGFYETPDCPCRSMAAKMDAWGPDGCEKPENFTAIIRYMIRQFRKRRRKKDGLSATAKLIVTTTPRRLVPVLAKRLVRQSIRLSRKRLKKQERQERAQSSSSK